MIQISIVILNWNGKEDTIECLKSVQKCQIPSIRQAQDKKFKCQIIVVDNGSTDGSITAIKKKFPKVEVVEIGRNLGFAGGNNVGVKKAIEDGADFVLVLNNDTTADENLLVHFIEALDNNKDVGILSPMIYFSQGYEYHKERYSKAEQGKVIWYAGGVIDWDNVLAANYGVDDTDIGQYENEREIDFATGACMFIRREVLEKFGMFNEKYYLYLEDADFSQRVKNAGYKVIFVPQAKVWHKVSQSSGIGSSLNDYYITRNRLLFGLKYAPWRAKLALFKESLKLSLSGRPWQRQAVMDFYKGNFGKGSFKQ